MLSPTAKQLESLLNDAESTCGVFGDSIFGLVFIASMRIPRAVAESLRKRVSKSRVMERKALRLAARDQMSWYRLGEKRGRRYPGSTVNSMADAMCSCSE